MLDILRPGDSRYGNFQHAYTATGSPSAIVRVRNAGETPEALAFALTAGGPLAVRSGGHGISSISTNDGGTVIDLSSLNSVERLGDTLVRLGPGARWGRVAHELYEWGLAITSGDSGDVGVGGLATTGGIGLLSRHQGLTIDRIHAVELLTPDGVIRRVDAEHEPDLFWAVRGAGANFGIVTAVELHAGVTPVVAHATIAFDISDTAGFLEQWGVAVEAAPHIVSAFLYLGVGLAQATIVVATDSEAEAADALTPFMSLPGVAGRRAHLVPYATVPLTTNAPHSGQQSAHSRSGLVNHLSTEVAGVLAGLLQGIDMVQIRSVGGAINDIAADATAYAHRHQNFSIQAVSMSSAASLDAAWAPVRELTDGMYLSFESAHRTEHLLDAFPEPALTRLRSLKKTWDPNRIFHQNFDITAQAGR